MGNLHHYTNFIKSLNAQAAEQDIYLICRLQEKRSQRIEAVGQEINEVSTTRIKGLGLHLFDKKGRSVLTSTDNLENKNRIIAILEQAIRSLLDTEGLNPWKGSTLGRVQPSRKFLRTKNLEIFALKPQKNQINLVKDFDFNTLTTTEIENKLLHLNQKIKKIGVGDSLKITSSFSIGQEAWRITRSDGTDISWELPKAVVNTHLTYEKDSKKVDDRLSQFSPGWDIFTKPQKQEKYLKKAAFVIRLLKESIGRSEYPAGNYSILIDSDLGGLLAHEAFGHAAESDAMYNNTSILSKKGQFRKGTEVASRTVSIIDETKPNTWGYQPYSAFGVPREKITIVRNGILQESLSDALSGVKIGDQIRGASRIESYANIPLPRMSRTFISVKEEGPKEKSRQGKESADSPHCLQQTLLKTGLLKDRVLVLRRGRGGGQVDPRTGTFMFGFAYLYEITPNSIGLFRGSSFSGQTLEALKAIKAGFGKVNTSHFGLCGKGGQWVSENSGANEFLFIDKTPYVTIGGS